jgi:ABC-type uncharacterized transport system permease subunit
MTLSDGLKRGVLAVMPIAAALLITALLVAAVGRSPIEVFERVWEGAFRNERTFAGVLNFWIPLTLAAAGLAITFRAGLWNIGVEGQIMAGAVGASVIPMAILQNEGLSLNTLPMELLLLASITLGATAGMLWGLVCGVLRTRLGINEIFGGVALNAIMNVLSIYFISGPWQPPIGGSAQGTQPFPRETLYPSISAEFPTSSLGISLALAAVAAVALVLWGTRWGLELKATGTNMRSAVLLGIATERNLLLAFMICGALAGIAGSYRVLFTYASLRPLVSGNIGFLGVLVILLIGVRPLLVPMITLGFAIVIVGSTRLRTTMQLDASLAGVLQGLLVLCVLIGSGFRQLWLSSSDEQARTALPSSEQPLPAAKDAP